MKLNLLLATSCAAVLLASSPRARAQSPLAQMEPYQNLYATYVELDAGDYAFGARLGRADSVLSVQTNTREFVDRYRLRFGTDSVVLDFFFPDANGAFQREVYRVPLTTAPTGTDEVIYRNTISASNFTFGSAELLKRYRSNGRLDSIRADIPADGNLYPGTRITRTERLATRRTSVTYERLTGDGRVFESRDSTVVRFGADGRIVGGGDYDFDYATGAYAAKAIYTYDYTASPRGRQMTLDVPPATELLRLQFTEATELTAIETIETGGGAPGSLLARLDDGGDDRVRKYLRPVLTRGVLFEDTWYYDAPLVATRELPLVEGRLVGANPIQAGGELRFDGFVDGARLQIVDNAGRVVEAVPLDRTSTYAWPGLPSGAYYLVVSAPGYQARAWPWIAQ